MYAYSCKDRLRLACAISSRCRIVVRLWQSVLGQKLSSKRLYTCCCLSAVKGKIKVGNSELISAREQMQNTEL